MSSFRLLAGRWFLFAGMYALGLYGCGGGGDDSGTSQNQPPPTPPPAQDNFNGRIYPLGTEITDSGTGLAVYAHAIDVNGNAVPKDSFKPSKILLKDGASGATKAELTNAVAVAPVTSGAAISVSFVTDYSSSMPDTSLQALPGIYTTIMNALPTGFTAEVIDYSSTIRPRIKDPAGNPVFTADLSFLQAAVQYIRDPYKGENNNPLAFRKASALYNALGYALYGPSGTGDGLKDGLLEQCTPVHLLILHSDGQNNVDSTYDKTKLLADIDASNTMPIILATESIDPAVTNIDALKELARPVAGSPDVTRGAFVYGHSPGEIAEAVNRYAASLQNMVKISIGGYTFTNGDVLEITMGAAIVSIRLQDYDIFSTCP